MGYDDRNRLGMLIAQEASQVIGVGFVQELERGRPASAIAKSLASDESSSETDSSTEAWVGRTVDLS